MKSREAWEQKKVIKWAAAREKEYDGLALLHHIPNGGRRDHREAAHLKEQGVKSGVPDLCLPVAKKGFHGLYIEMKAGKNRPTINQKVWIDALREQGYKAVVCYGAEEAVSVREEYYRED